jgi:hypothetical protein
MTKTREVGRCGLPSIAGQSSPKHVGGPRMNYCAMRTTGAVGSHTRRDCTKNAKTKGRFILFDLHIRFTL